MVDDFFTVIIIPPTRRFYAARYATRRTTPMKADRQRELFSPKRGSSPYRYATLKSPRISIYHRILGWAKPKQKWVSLFPLEKKLFIYVFKFYQNQKNPFLPLLSPPTPLLPSVSLQRGISLSLQAVLRLLPAPPLRAGPSPPLLRLTPLRQKDPRNWRKNSKQRLLRSIWHLHLSPRRREVPKKLHLKRVSFL